MASLFGRDEATSTVLFITTVSASSVNTKLQRDLQHLGVSYETVLDDTDT